MRRKPIQNSATDEAIKAQREEAKKLHEETCTELTQTNAKADSLLEKLRQRLKREPLRLVKVRL